MGSVGSGASIQRPVTMRSVGTRTTPNGARCRLDERSFSAERLPHTRAHPEPPVRSQGVSFDQHRPQGTCLDQHTPKANANQRERAPMGAHGGFGHRRGESLDLCGNKIERNAGQQNFFFQQNKEKEMNRAKAEHHKQTNGQNSSGKLDSTQSGDPALRPSAFKPVVPKSFHSMQNLLCPLQSGSGSGASAAAPENDSSGGSSSSGGGGGAGEKPSASGLSDSGRNSLTSLPTIAGSGFSSGSGFGSGFAPLGPMSASTSHINRLGSERPGQNGLSVSDSGRGSSGKSSGSYPRLGPLSDPSGPLRPSPSSDDVIQELEDRLWEREQEVLHMRRNLDQSEAAIVQVFEEKQRLWEREMEDLRQNLGGRLQQLSRRAQRSQHSLQTQMNRLTQDKQRLQDELTLLLAHRDQLENQCLDFKKEQAQILPRLEETKWEVCQKAGEISLLKQQLRESQAEVSQRAGEMVALRGQIKELSAQLREREEVEISLKESFCSKTLELERCEAQLQSMLAEVTVLRDKLSAFDSEVSRLKKALGDLSSASHDSVPSLPLLVDHPLTPPEILPTSLSVPEAMLSLQSDDSKAQHCHDSDLRHQLERLHGELRLERQQRQRQAQTFAQERQTWHQEKERVLKYQAQLQLSYVEMLQKNQALEERVDVLGKPPEVPALPAPEASVSVSLTSPTPPVVVDEKKMMMMMMVPELSQLAPPVWPATTRLERIESTEI